MDVTATAALAVNMQTEVRNQEMGIAMTKMIMDGQSQAAVSLVSQATDQAKAAAAQARGGIDIIA